MGFNDREGKRSVGRNVVSAIVGKTATEETDNIVKGGHKSERETKKRVSLMILPSIYEDIQKIAYVNRSSISEIVAECLRQYAMDNADKLEEYKRIKGA